MTDIHIVDILCDLHGLDYRIACPECEQKSTTASVTIRTQIEERLHEYGRIDSRAKIYETPNNIS